VRRAVVLGLTAVLLLGSAVLLAPQETLASWLDDERGAADFTAGMFQSQSQTEGSAEWATHSADQPAELSLTGLSGLAPGGGLSGVAGDPQYFWLNLRTAPGSDWDAALWAGGTSATGGLAPALEYRLAPRTPSTTACTAADFANVGDVWLPVTTPLTGDSNVRIGTDGVGLCFAVRVAASAAGAANSGFQGQSADLSWTFTLLQD